MTQSLRFYDSWDGQSAEGGATPEQLYAVDRFNQAAREGSLPFVELSGRRRRPPAPLGDVIRCSFREPSADAGGRVAARFDVSHYVGSYATEVGGQTVEVEIRPRWGADWLAYLLRFTTGIYVPPDAAARAAARSDGAEWVLVIVWRSLLRQALRRFHLPKEYRPHHTNGPYFRGRLDVGTHLRLNLTDQSRFACVHSPLTPDITINRTIRHVLHLLERHGYGSLVGDLLGYGERLASFGVKRPEIAATHIDTIRYTKMSAGYRPLMQVSRAVLRRFGTGREADVSSGGASFLVDMAELWENYLQAVLTEHLPEGYQILNPNESGGEWLLAGERREVRPDLLVKRQGHVVAVLDAKFKGYTRIGKYERDGVRRGDLYQMATYLYHYGQETHPILGVFISPAAGPGEVVALVHNDFHHVGILNFGLPPWGSSPEVIVGEERAFCLSQAKTIEAQFANNFWQRLQVVLA